jgi:hypothetical protein
VPAALTSASTPLAMLSICILRTRNRGVQGKKITAHLPNCQFWMYPVKLSLKAMIIAGALFKTIVFLFISLMNLVLRPYGGAYLAMLSSLYPGYDPVNVPIAVIVGTIYSLLAGALAGLLFACLYNFFADRT